MKSLTKNKLTEAIIKAVGNKSAVMSMLNIGSHHTLNSYIKRWNLAELVDQQTEKINDKAEHNVAKWINEGNEKVTLWWLERRMYAKYGNKQTVINETDEPLKIIVESSALKDKIDKI
ncbi:MAG TPA: hypothetical protein PLH15_10575 [Spirochaetota bacterium]|nr:hypothetical protein [Spirochaetota bacterium]HQQ24272.1 hypothetical protein [Spirochaetota bacterium]